MYHPIYLNVLFLTQIASLWVLDIPLLQLLSEGIEAIKHTGHTHLQKPSFGDGFSGGQGLMKLAVQTSLTFLFRNLCWK